MVLHPVDHGRPLIPKTPRSRQVPKGSIDQPDGHARSIEGHPNPMKLSKPETATAQLPHEVGNGFEFAIKKFVSISKVLSATLPPLSEFPREAVQIREFVESRRMNARIIPVRSALAFNQAFLWKNLLKCMIALSISVLPSLKRPLRLLDVGSGAGVFSIAWAQTNRPFHDTIQLIDRDSAQLAIARTLANAIHDQHWAFRETEFPGSIQEPESYRLASYWLCEQNLEQVCGDAQRFAHCFGPGAIVVDYPDIIESLATFSRTAGYEEIANYSFSVDLPPLAEGLIRDPKLSLNCIEIMRPHGRESH